MIDRPITDCAEPLVEAASGPKSRSRRPVAVPSITSAAIAISAVMSLGGVCSANDVLYEWKPLKIGGGGWVTGAVSHPTEADVRYARTDTGGFYKWDPVGDEWDQLGTIDRFSDVSGWEGNTGVEAIAIAATDSDTVYTAWRDRLYRSTDGGESFQGVGPSSIPMSPNGSGRFHGERLAVDPRNEDVAYFGSRSSGLYRTTNGTSWSSLPGSSIPTANSTYGVTVVKFDPNSPEVSGRTSGVYAAVAGSGIYHSSNAGSSWQNLSSLSGGPRNSGIPSDLELHPDGSVYVTYSGGSETGLWRYRSGAGWGSGGSDWQKLSPSSNRTHVSVAIDPFDPTRIVTGTNGLGNIWVSEDSGSTWRDIDFTRVSPDIPWAEITAEFFFSTGEFYFDPVTPGVMRVANGIGMWEADSTSAALADDEITWEFDSAGIEQIVTRDILAPPGQSVVTFGWDRTAYKHDDPDSYNATQAYPFALNHGWAGAYRPNDPMFMVTTAADENPGRGAVNRAGYSTDGGATWNIFRSVLFGSSPDELKYGAIAAATSSEQYPDSIVWAPPRGTDVRPYYSNDRGQTWTEVAEGDWIGGSTGFVNEFVRPHLLIADPHQAGAYYFQVPDRGLARSEDGGVTWERLNNDIPCCGYNGRLLADPVVDDKLWYAHGRQSAAFQRGLWKSTDGADSFLPISGVNYAIDVALGAAAPGSSLLTVYLVGEVLGQEGIFRSLDDGASWEQIGHYPLGIFDDITVLAASPDEFGMVYLGFSGTGFAYGQLVPLTITGDYNGDGMVDAADFTLARDNIGGDAETVFAAGSRGLGVTGPIDIGDINAWSNNYGATNTANAFAQVPEPGGLVLFGLGSLLAAAGRRVP